MNAAEMAKQIEARKDLLAAAVVARDCEDHPEYAERYDGHARAMHLQDTGYHLSFLAQAVGLRSRKLFSEYIHWVQGILARLGIAGEALADNLRNVGRE